jgi:hypothetical protein
MTIRCANLPSQGVRYKAAVIWDLFWTPFDQRFADILSRIKRHREEFDSGLTTVYSEEMMRHFNAMDEERLKNAQQWEVLLSTRVAAEKDVMGRLMTHHHPLGKADLPRRHENSELAKMDRSTKLDSAFLFCKGEAID